MQFDRHEAHVLNELHERYDFFSPQLQQLHDLRRLSVVYSYGQDFITCLVSDATDPNRKGTGISLMTLTEPTNVERIGRMIAFARAVLDFTKTRDLLYQPDIGLELEAIALGNSSYAG